jgi:putative heme iron utilization protein
VVSGSGGRAALRLGFDAAVATPAEVRPAMIRLVEQARRAAES